MRKVLKYPNYKESDVEWLGSIPEHWKIVKAKRILREVSIKNHPDEPLLAATQTKGVIPKSLYENTTVTASKNFETLKLVRKGDFVISLRSFQGGIEYAHYKGIISPAYTILEPQDEVFHNYYRYLLKSKRYISGLTLLVTGIREGQNIDTSKFKDSFLPLPPKEEQTAIARFLDYKLAKINRFIQKKKQLIKLLNEQKAAIINQAVTKGLDPNAKMKESGIEWLGEIPEHWEVRKLKYDGKIKSGDGITSNEIEEKGNYEVYGGNGFIGFANKFNVEGENLIIGRVGAKCGNVHFINSKKFISDNALILTLNPGLNYTYYSMVLEVSNLNTLNTSSAQPLITGTKVMNYPIPIAPKKEQQQIVYYIEQETTIINTTISKIEKEIALVEEYKTALIAEAVTGKIDVRGYQVPEVESEEESDEELEAEMSMAAEDADDYQTEEME